MIIIIGYKILFSMLNEKENLVNKLHIFTMLHYHNIIGPLPSVAIPLAALW